MISKSRANAAKTQGIGIYACPNNQYHAGFADRAKRDISAKPFRFLAKIAIRYATAARLWLGVAAFSTWHAVCILAGMSKSTQTALALAADTEPLEQWCAEHPEQACAVAEQTAGAWPHLPPSELSEVLRLRLQLVVSLGADRALAALGVVS